MTPDEVISGITIRVPNGADIDRPGVKYLLRIERVEWIGHANNSVKVFGPVFRVDGSPTTARHKKRSALVWLDRITKVED